MQQHPLNSVKIFWKHHNILEACFFGMRKHIEVGLNFSLAVGLKRLCLCIYDFLSCPVFFFCWTGWGWGNWSFWPTNASLYDKYKERYRPLQRSIFFCGCWYYLVFCKTYQQIQKNNTIILISFIICFTTLVTVIDLEKFSHRCWYYITDPNMFNLKH